MGIFYSQPLLIHPIKYNFENTSLSIIEVREKLIEEMNNKNITILFDNYIVNSDCSDEWINNVLRSLYNVLDNDFKEESWDNFSREAGKDKKFYLYTQKYENKEFSCLIKIEIKEKYFEFYICKFIS